jgi:ABC-type Zn uptake system ZnuABC Zn-binding protein ZnuA
MRHSIKSTWISALLFLGLTAISCQSVGDESFVVSTESEDLDASRVLGTEQGIDYIKVVTSTNILADWVKSIGGDKVQVRYIIPADTDPHGFKPSPRDIKYIQEADIVFFVGRHYEESWLEKLSTNVVGIDGKLKYVSDSLTLGESISGEDDVNALNHNELVDLHFWHDPILVVDVVKNISKDLGLSLEKEQRNFEANADMYVSELQQLDEWIFTQIDTIPKEKRVLITSHKTMKYFGDRYGFRMTESIMPNVSSTESVTPKQLGSIIEVIEEYQVRTIFGDPYMSSDIGKSLSVETGVNVIILNMESLSAESDGSSSYVSMMRENVTNLVNGLYY